jgi:hypothetical protein
LSDFLGDELGVSFRSVNPFAGFGRTILRSVPVGGGLRGESWFQPKAHWCGEVAMTETMSRPIGSNQVAVLRAGGAYALVARRSIPRDNLMFRLEGACTRAPTRYSVQVGTDLHLDLPDGCGIEEIMDRFYWRFMNHSCAPSAVVRGRYVFARRIIQPQQEITFNYNTTEFELAEPFECCCGSDHCAGRIGGFRYLVPAERERLRPWLADHLLSLLDETCR